MAIGRRRVEDGHWKAAPGRIGRLASVQATCLAVLGLIAVAITLALTQQVETAQRTREAAEATRSELIEMRDALRVEHVEFWKRRAAGERGVPATVAIKVSIAVPRVQGLRARVEARGAPDAIAVARRAEALILAVQRGLEDIRAAAGPQEETRASDRNEAVIADLAGVADAWVDIETGLAAEAAVRQERLAERLNWLVSAVVAAVIAAALVAGFLLERTRRQVVDDLKGAADHLEDLSVTDALTGLANRRGFDQALGVERARAQRTGRPLALVLFDIDHFKEVNDELGHAAGDLVLQEVARRLESVARTHELVARVGGEEFAWLLPDADGAAALVAAERAREVVAAWPIGGVEVTVSAGVSDHALAGDRILESADAALYVAKDAGRNRSVRA